MLSTNKKVAPASGAIIMALGIFLIGDIHYFSKLETYFGKLFSIFLLMTWIFIYTRLSIQVFQKNYFLSLIRDPINSFTIGTWIAGVSVLIMVYEKYFPSYLLILKWFTLCNIIMWILYLFICLNSFKKLLFTTTTNRNNFHGGILLSTVATQSIVVSMGTMFEWLPLFIFKALIILGVIFYVVGMGLIVRHYSQKQNWKIATKWTNTNCIIHGALSITGLAICITNSFTSLIICVLWLTAFTMVLLIEIIEIIRGYKRIQIFGLKEGLLSYDITQWSRNFTFGMFFTFTLFLLNSRTYQLPNFIRNVQEVFLPLWAWVVLVTLVIELFISIASTTKDYKSGNTTSDMSP